MILVNKMLMLTSKSAKNDTSYLCILSIFDVYVQCSLNSNHLTIESKPRDDWTTNKNASPSLLRPQAPDKTSLL